ncbi:MCE family protein [Mycobacterium sp. 1274756.6]|uniref:MCE family protein n=1 Tax=Mycobacterium sp. 1274756.6 TaxID=1834076 RepID=UPI0007FFDD5B|nr:MCE family protein [Mycobacterium sp. 1274756.6]OBJ67828.1 mammalian cell entry protein [Mycobacterium sp. 1274756.6]
MNKRGVRRGIGILLTLVLIGGAVATQSIARSGRTYVTAYFDNANGIYPGDNVVILGVPVGKIEQIDPEPSRVKITFWYDDRYLVPDDANAVILSPSLVTVRVLELTPAYTGGHAMAEGSVIPLERTAVPVEWDDLRQQLEKLTDTLQPTEAGGVSSAGALVSTAADNLRGQGQEMRAMVLQLSQAVSALGDHSGDIFHTFKNLAALVAALRDNSSALGELNDNLATVTTQLANDPDEVGQALRDLNAVVGDVTAFVADNRDALGTTSEKLASVSQAVAESLDDIKQTLHIAPTALQNFVNIYEPAHGSLSGVLATSNFANPVQFLCSAVQAASRLNAEQSAKLCVQYLAPIVKNRQYNYFPLGENLFVGATARPNEITYSEDWLRPDYIPPGPEYPVPTDSFRTVDPPPDGPLPPANTIYDYFGNHVAPDHGDAPYVPAKPPNPLPVDPATGLPGMMLPPEDGE